jgi:NAD(P)-dependent dehydrogenase (short-subunit alcohol dehydrogenase family)
MRQFSYAGKLVVISGGARGLGLVLARELIRLGARVAICCREQDQLERGVEQLASLSETLQRGDLFSQQCDVTDPQQVATFLKAVRAWGGPIDVLINNAGAIVVGPSETMLLSDYDEALALHVRAPVTMIEGVLPDMRARGDGRIINISSLGGVVAFPHLAPYCASKHALVGLSDALRTELVRDGIFVTTVTPAPIRTGSHVNARFKGEHEVEQTIFSILTTNPLLSVNATRAARRILHGAACGRGRVTIGWLAHALTLLDRLTPELTRETFTALERLVPHPYPAVSVARSGRKSQTPLSPSFLTRLGDQQVALNNEG